MALTVFGFCGLLPAQQPDKPPAPAADASAAPAERPPDKHIFGVLPNYRTADPTQSFHALSPGGKFNIALHDSFDPPGYFIAAWYTAIYHLENTNPEFGQGLQGYLHRYATTYADQMLGNMMTEGAMPSLLHEDPRYYRRAHGSIPVRAAWAVSRIFVTRTDRDTYRFNFSEIPGMESAPDENAVKLQTEYPGNVSTGRYGYLYPLRVWPATARDPQFRTS